MPQLHWATPTPTVPPKPPPAIMGLATPQTTPPGSTMPTLRTFPQPKHAERKEVQGDMFLDMLQGPCITIHLKSRRYTLPIALLCAHSNYLRTEIMKLVHHSSTAAGGNKKRKLSAIDSEISEETNGDDERMKQGLSLRLDDVDHVSFGLFVKFMYTGGYAASVDARGTSSPYIPTPTTPSIPPSIHAYLLVHRLQSISFMNHTLLRIYHGIGAHFVLTPGLVGWVWGKTSIPPPTSTSTPTPTSTASTSLTTQASTTTTTPPTSASQAQQVPHPPAPLRTLFLDVLTTHWPSHHAHIIARNSKAGWSAVFDAHADLRRDMMFGMQEGGKVKHVREYFAGVGTVMGWREEKREAGDEKEGKQDGEKEGTEKMSVDGVIKVEGDEAGR